MTEEPHPPNPIIPKTGGYHDTQAGEAAPLSDGVWHDMLLDVACGLGHRMVMEYRVEYVGQRESIGRDGTVYSFPVYKRIACGLGCGVVDNKRLMHDGLRSTFLV